MELKRVLPYKPPDPSYLMWSRSLCRGFTYFGAKTLVAAAAAAPGWRKIQNATYPWPASFDRCTPGLWDEAVEVEENPRRSSRTATNSASLSKPRSSGCVGPLVLQKMIDVAFDVAQIFWRVFMFQIGVANIAAVGMMAWQAYAVPAG